MSTIINAHTSSSDRYFIIRKEAVIMRRDGSYALTEYLRIHPIRRLEEYLKDYKEDLKDYRCAVTLDKWFCDGILECVEGDARIFFVPLKVVKQGTLNIDGFFVLPKDVINFDAVRMKI